MIVPIHAANPGPWTGQGNWTYLLVGVQSALVDAGAGNAAHLDEIALHLPDGPDRVYVTHAHSDHASGAPAIAARWPRTRFWKMPWPERDVKYDVPWNALIDGQVVPAGDESLEVVHTPGHAPDHYCLWHAPSRTLFSADLVVLGSTVVIPASQGGSLVEYLQSLERVLALAPSRLLPAHGVPIDDPAAVIRGYLAHRVARERQVLSAVSDGLGTVEAITDRIYAGLSEALVPMARESVLAHLVKLEHDGRVRHLGVAWKAQS